MGDGLAGGGADGVGDGLVGGGVGGSDGVGDGFVGGGVAEGVAEGVGDGSAAWAGGALISSSADSVARTLNRRMSRPLRVIVIILRTRTCGSMADGLDLRGRGVSVRLVFLTCILVSQYCATCEPVVPHFRESGM